MLVAAMNVAFAMFFFGTFVFGACSIVSIALLSSRAADDTDDFSLFRRPYSAKHMQQSSAAVETMNRLEKETKLGRFANKSLAMMTLFGVLMIATIALDLGLSKHLVQPSALFASGETEAVKK
ncbi:hypothetical protein J7399_16950 [Shimia sp. R9_1]|uniref:hypothetical protein n=1 Tax=Shimia sp. R9_1 TaxID=2821111 RepID=UPI001AD981AC|nr:hypothetical protein [Shimia sp. R9_1]MBO9409127.1 hypothetical protein [Shimia sp. R9_1]